jgi:hypothetical protein
MAQRRNLIMKTQHPIWPTAFALALGGAGAHAAAAPCANAGIVRATIDGHAYQSGGRGEEQVVSMKSAAAAYNLRMTFSEGKHARHVAGLKLRIENAAGRRVFAFDDAGPLTDVDLPAGRYHVHADRDGVQRSASVIVKLGGHTDVHLHWANEAA